MGGGRYIQPVSSGEGRIIWADKKRDFLGGEEYVGKDATKPGLLARCELDTRADTTCAGANFHLHCFTGTVCTVAPFSDTYTPMADIPVATALTAHTDEDGRTWILVFNEVLWFGSSMGHSLINPNQIRCTGIPVSDNPFDESKDLGISADKTFIPFGADGTTIFFETRVPTLQEINECQHIVMTADHEWDPSAVRLAAVRTTEEEGFRRIAKIALDPKSIEFESDAALIDCSPAYNKRHSQNG